MSETVEQLDFFYNPEARVERAFQRASQHEITHRGRKTTAELFPRPEGIVVSDIIPEDQVVDYAKRHQDNFPLFNDFTDHAHISPTKKSIDDYCTAGNKVTNEKRIQEKRGRQLLSILGLPISLELPPLEKDSMRRQTFTLADNLQRNILIDRDTSRLWRASVGAIRRQIIFEDEKLDEVAQKNTLSSVMDFGRTVIQEAEKTGNQDDKEFGLNIAYLFQASEEEIPQIFRTNPVLLKLVQLNLKAHDDYWSVRYDATLKFLGRRLTNEEFKSSKENQKEVERLMLLAR